VAPIREGSSPSTLASRAATDLYLSAFPLMTTDLDTTATSVQLTLTAFLIGIALGQLVFGPLSDRFGRMMPLVVGLLLCLAASAATALAPTVELLVAARSPRASPARRAW
jgi:DHA1 family bicyclomycin/chloramphenicol resistance-like MFS transporter